MPLTPATLPSTERSAALINAPAAIPAPGPTLAAALLGFFVITLDAVVVNVALPAMAGSWARG